jgi:hypothetical protein
MSGSLNISLNPKYMKSFFTYFLSFVAAILFGAFTVSNVSAQATANLQIIHNSPDPAVSTVDIFVNGDEFLADVDFRSATAFTDVPAGVDLDVQIAPANAGIENAVGPFTFNLTEDENYQLIASGVVDPSAFTGAAGFTLEAYTPAQTEAADPSMVDVNVHHGSPDAPAVDVYTEQTGDTPPITNLAYPEFTGYVSLAPNNEMIGVAGAGGDILAEFSAPLADLNAAGASITVLASGFFDSNNASDGNGFGLLAVLADGTALLLDPVETAPMVANVQIIHNSPDPAASSVDVYVNGELTLPGVEFRTATEFLELPGDTPLDITVTPADAAIEDGIEFTGVEFASGENYYVVASGVLDPMTFADNPDGVDTSFFLDVIPNASTTADESNFDFLIYHGAPDAPAVDVAARDVAPLANGVSYTDYSADYISVPANSYIIDISAAGADNPLVSFDADVSTLGGQTGVILASGFLDPTSNNDGPGFGVIVVLTDGTVVELGMATSNENVADGLPERFDLDQNYPNPFNPSTTISYSLPQSSQVTVEVYNITGQRVATLVNTEQSAGNYTVNFDASSLSSGMYMYRIQAENFTQTRKMTLIK